MRPSICIVVLAVHLIVWECAASVNSSVGSPNDEGEQSGDKTNKEDTGTKAPGKVEVSAEAETDVKAVEEGCTVTKTASSGTDVKSGTDQTGGVVPGVPAVGVQQLPGESGHSGSTSAPIAVPPTQTKLNASYSDQPAPAESDVPKTEDTMKHEEDIVKKHENEAKAKAVTTKGVTTDTPDCGLQSENLQSSRGDGRGTGAQTQDPSTLGERPDVNEAVGIKPHNVNSEHMQSATRDLPPGKSHTDTRGSSISKSNTTKILRTRKVVGDPPKVKNDSRTTAEKHISQSTDNTGGIPTLTGISVPKDAKPFTKTSPYVPGTIEMTSESITTNVSSTDSDSNMGSTTTMEVSDNIAFPTDTEVTSEVPTKLLPIVPSPLPLHQSVDKTDFSLCSSSLFALAALATVAVVAAAPAH